MGTVLYVFSKGQKIVPQNGDLSDESPDKRPKRSSRGTKCFPSYAATPFRFSSTNFT